VSTGESSLKPETVGVREKTELQGQIHQWGAKVEEEEALLERIKTTLQVQRRKAKHEQQLIKRAKEEWRRGDSMLGGGSGSGVVKNLDDGGALTMDFLAGSVGSTVLSASPSSLARRAQLDQQAQAFNENLQQLRTVTEWAEKRGPKVVEMRTKFTKLKAVAARLGEIDARQQQGQVQLGMAAEAEETSLLITDMMELVNGMQTIAVALATECDTFFNSTADGGGQDGMGFGTSATTKEHQNCGSNQYQQATRFGAANPQPAGAPPLLQVQSMGMGSFGPKLTPFNGSSSSGFGASYSISPINMGHAPQLQQRR
jgi:hypothetical protein